MRFLLAFLTLFAGPAYAQTVVDPTQIALVCAYNSVVPAPTSGQYAFVQCDSTGKLLVAGAGGTPGGSANQIQYNNAGAFGGFTVSGDATLVPSTGVITVASIGGKPTGTSGATIPVLNVANTWGATQTFTSMIGSSLIVNNAHALQSSNLVVWNGAQVGFAAGAAVTTGTAADTYLTRVAAGVMKTNGAFGTGAVAVGSLPVAATAGVGARHFVTDATACTFGVAITGGGSTKCPVYSDGTSWLGG